MSLSNSLSTLFSFLRLLTFLTLLNFSTSVYGFGRSGSAGGYSGVGLLGKKRSGAPKISLLQKAKMRKELKLYEQIARVEQIANAKLADEKKKEPKVSFLARKFIRPSRLQSEADKKRDAEKLGWINGLKERASPAARKIPLLSRLKMGRKKELPEQTIEAVNVDGDKVES